MLKKIPLPLILAGSAGALAWLLANSSGKDTRPVVSLDTALPIPPGTYTFWVKFPEDMSEAVIAQKKATLQALPNFKLIRDNSDPLTMMYSVTTSTEMMRKEKETSPDGVVSLITGGVRTLHPGQAVSL